MFPPQDPTSTQGVYDRNYLQQEQLAAYTNQARIAAWNRDCVQLALNHLPPEPVPMMVKVVPTGTGAFSTWTLGDDKPYESLVTHTKPTFKSAVGIHYAGSNNFSYVEDVIPTPKVGDNYIKDPRGPFHCTVSRANPFGTEVLWQPGLAPAAVAKTKKK